MSRNGAEIRRRGVVVVEIEAIEAFGAQGDRRLESASRNYLASLLALLARAAKVSDAGWRTSFLENLPENARTVQLARELLAIACATRAVS
jgi:hypothetical protein